MFKSAIWQLAAKSTLHNVSMRNQLFPRPVIWSLVRTYAGNTKEVKIKTNVGIIDNYVPPEIIPYPIWKTRYFLIRYRNFKNFVKNTLHSGHIKNHEPKLPEDERYGRKWKERAKFLYEEMNQAFAKDDRIALNDICVDSMSTTLKNQISKRAPRTRWEWNLEEDIDEPRIICIRYIPLDVKLSIGQVTVRFHTKQLIVVYDKKGNILAGSPKETKNVLEYVVFQRMLDQPGETWKICGKVGETEQKF